MKIEAYNLFLPRHAEVPWASPLVLINEMLALVTVGGEPGPSAACFERLPKIALVRQGGAMVEVPIARLQRAIW